MMLLQIGDRIEKFDGDIVVKNKLEALNFLKSKYEHLKNLEINKYEHRKDVGSINDKLENVENNEIRYAIDLGDWAGAHARAFVYGKVDNKPFIMYFDYTDENDAIGFSKMKDNKKITKIVLPRIQSDGDTCFMFQTKMFQTMTPGVIRNFVKCKQTQHKYTTGWLINSETKRGAYHTFEYPAVHIEIQQLPKELLTYMQSLTKMEQLDNGKEIFNENKKRGFIQKGIDNHAELKEQNKKAISKTVKLYRSESVDDSFFNDLYSVDNGDLASAKKKNESGCSI